MADLTPLLAFRWSPRAFDPTATLPPADAASLLEAARWAPSAGNRQPWRFALGHRDDETYKRILVNLPAAEQRWARHAAALLLGAHLTAEPAGDADGGAWAGTQGHAAGPADSAGVGGDHGPAVAGPAGRAAYDLGQAVAHLTVQATALGLYVRQLAAFDAAGLAADLELPAGIRPLVVAAVGRLGDPFSLPEELLRQETGLRRRRPLAELLLR
ncbi:nitroreductase family protein [Micromonospora sp. NBC_01655]|uniref:nitroreductase family protein n=1 Tax=Micromonospora sp. NBC_01655 TaxID=2975983 RepID=UPI002255E241|nr:nitroreductase family protein [Micromonospora sp. NBC_01655]MCX4469554.1 nitroreductase family protein [Micromonospora sp. NBC_01655]